MQIQKAFFQASDLPAQLIVVSLDRCVVLPGTIIIINLNNSFRQHIDFIQRENNGILGIVNSQNIETIKIGTLAKILAVQLSGQDVILEVKTVGRFQIKEVLTKNPLVVRFKFVQVENEQNNIKALYNTLCERFNKFLQLTGRQFLEGGFESISDRIDSMANALSTDIGWRQEILETIDVKKRLEKILNTLDLEMRKFETQIKIFQNIGKNLKNEQDKKILELLHQDIHKQLGITDDKEDDIAEYQKRLDSIDLPEKAREEAEKELERLSRMSPSSSEAEVVRTYLGLIIDLPWETYTEDGLDIKKARKILQEDHYGLESIKETIIENLAVKVLNPNARGAILCFVGPPGVGKTSMGKSIARALGREFYRISLGGVRDEAEIRGHRRTYIGALPGNIIQGIQRAGTNNPVFMLDEIDKLGSDHRGDPSSALLEALDPEQNNSFSDHYLSVPFDLSKVMFITTANDLYSIPNPLRDRMEVIQLPGYTQEEKVKIAEKHLVPRQIMSKGLADKNIQFSEAAIKNIIASYTAEAGVRELEQKIAKICRKIAVGIIENNSRGFKIHKQDVKKYLGNGQQCEQRLKNILPGVVAGLAWTPMGGELLYIETLVFKDPNPSCELTGQLGDVMQESAMIALNFAQANIGQFNIEDENFFNENKVHIHVPGGAVPKDGPSAGITMLTALISRATGKRVRDDIAMTGEITLRGDVVAVGGVKEKVLAAYREGIKCIILPKNNKQDIDDIPSEIKKKMQFKFFHNMIDAVNFALKD